jgi:nucleoside-diphosphate-sugar epimerase
VAGEEWMTWEGYHQGLAAAIGAKTPEFVYIPTDVLVQLAPEEAYLSEVNFSYNNLFDNTAAREDLGFRVTIPWVEGARRTIKWLADNGKLENSEDFPFYDRIIEAWQKAVGNLTETLRQ